MGSLSEIFLPKIIKIS